MTLTPNVPAAPVPRAAEKIVVVNDSERGDGGKSTDDERVNTDQIRKIEKSALDHTVEESGS